MRVYSGFLILMLAACGGAASSTSKVVGGACATDRDCDHRCITSDTFGGGMCTVSCTTDNDCPTGSACLASSHDGPFCAVTCSIDSDCSNFGRGWVCKSQSHQSGGNISICRLP